jgi:hypothetical protein
MARAGGAPPATAADVSAILDGASAAFMGAVDLLEPDLRRVNHAFFACCTGCTDDSRTADATRACVDK